MPSGRIVNEGGIRGFEELKRSFLFILLPTNDQTFEPKGSQKNSWSNFPLPTMIASASKKGYVFDQKTSKSIEADFTHGTIVCFDGFLWSSPSTWRQTNWKARGRVSFVANWLPLAFQIGCALVGVRGIQYK